MSAPPVHSPLILKHETWFSWFIPLLYFHALFLDAFSGLWYLFMKNGMEIYAEKRYPEPFLFLCRQYCEWWGACCWRDWQTLECKTSYTGSIGWASRSIFGFLLGGHQGQGSLTLGIATIGHVLCMQSELHFENQRLTNFSPRAMKMKIRLCLI